MIVNLRSVGCEISEVIRQGLERITCGAPHVVFETVQNKMDSNRFSTSPATPFPAISSCPTKIRDIAVSPFPKYPTVSCPSLSPGILLQYSDEFSPLFPME